MGDNSKKPGIRFKGFTDDWEQRKLGELGSLKNGMNFSKKAMGIGFPFVNLQNIFGNNVIDVSNLGKAMASDSQLKDYNLLNGDVLFVRSSVKLEGVGEAALVPQTLDNTTYSGFIIRFRDEYGLDNNFKRFVFGIESVRNQIMSQATNSANKNISQSVLENLELAIPSKSEQQKIGAYFSNLDHLITLHQRKCCELKKLKQYMANHMFVNQSIKCDRNIATNHKKLQERTKEMGELESVIEQRLIDQLCGGDSQWTYRKDIRTEEQLWDNFKYILEQNNKAKLNDMPLSESEFAKIKNDVSHASFYDAGKWQVGENGKVYVHVQRGNETLHLVVMNNEHIAGGTSVYEVSGIQDR